MVRLNKYLASCGLGSRRKVEELIQAGKIKVNGVVVTNLATTINAESDIVSMGRNTLHPQEQKIFIMLNKPRGYITTKKDEFNRKTVYDLLPDFAKELHPVGRLDYDSEGLLLLTNDGDITNKITHPANKMEKIYKVIIKGQLSQENLKKLREGIELDGVKTQTARVFLKASTPEKSELRIGIHEGKNRQVRRMLEVLGHEVTSLKRLQIGDIKLEKLPVGNWRFLTDREVLGLVKRNKSPFP